MPACRPFFFYGSLLDRDVLALVLARSVAARELQPAWLAGWRRVRVAGESYPALARCRGACLAGALFTPRSAAEADRIRFFEAHDYRLRRRAVSRPGRPAVPAWVCVARRHVRATAATWRPAGRLAGGRQTFLARCRAYMACHGRMSPAEAEPVWEQWGEP